MNRSSFPFSQCWRVVLAFCALTPFGEPSVYAQGKKSASHNFEKRFAGSMARMLRIQNPNVRALMREAIRRTGIVESPVLSRDGKTLVYRGAKNQSYALKSEKGVVRPIVFPPMIAGTNALWFDSHGVDSLFAAFSPNGRLFACMRPSEENGHQLLTNVSLFDTRTWKVVRVLGPQSNTVRSIAFSADGERALVGNAGGGATIYDVASGRVLSQWHYKNNFKGLVVAFAQTPQGEKAVALTVRWWYFAYSNVPIAEQDAGIAEPAQLWDVQSNEKLADFPELADATGAAFDSKGSQVALTGNESSFQKGKQPICKIVVAQWQVAPSSNSRVLLSVGTNSSATSLLWTPDDQTLIATGVGYGDDWFEVFDHPLQPPSKP